MIKFAWWNCKNLAQVLFLFAELKFLLWFVSSGFFYEYLRAYNINGVQLKIDYIISFLNNYLMQR